MGIGLGGARRLVNDFVLTTEVGQGTTVTVTQWKRR
jgi:serine/threonine-protein kinase RsbT